MIRYSAMKAVSYQDYFKIQRCYDASHLDYGALTDFYMPLIGTDGLAIYLDLLREEDNATFHEHLFAHLGLTPGEFINAMNALEATGLVRTFVEEGSGCEVFTYALFAPLSADEFNQDIMLSATLKGKLGQQTYDRYLSRHVGEKPNADLEEITSSFPSVFSTSLDAKLYLNTTKGKLNEKATAKTGFDQVAFVRLLDTRIRKNLFSEEELAVIGKASALYGLSNETLADIVEGCLVHGASFGKRLDRKSFLSQAQKAMKFDYLKPSRGKSSDVHGDSVMASKIRMMDQCSPAKWLSYLQNNHRPAQKDLRLIETLSMEIGLPDPCINALLDFVLQKNDNVLSAPYCEKLAASLVREGCQSSRDAMDYLLRSSRRGGKASSVATKKPAQPMTEEAPEQEENASKEEVDALLDDLFKDWKK